MIMNLQLHDTFAKEHRQTEHLLDVLKRLAKEHKWQAICGLTQHLFKDLKNHINVEEKYVYPVVEHCIQDEDLLRTLAILHKRHIEIPNYVLEIEGNAQDRDESETILAIELLERVLSDHHRTEESYIFPLFDRDGPLSASAESAVLALEKGHGQ